MTIYPDYGLKLIQIGAATGFRARFYDFKIFSLSVLGLGQYSTTVNLPLDGEIHAVSLDFNQEHLLKILDKAPRSAEGQILKSLVEDPFTPRSIDLDEEISFGVTANLGALVKGPYENFVPLVAVEIF